MVKEEESWRGRKEEKREGINELIVYLDGVT